MAERRAPLRVVIVGATSGIAEATARLYAAEGARLVLVGRNAERLESVAADLRVRGAAEVVVAVTDGGSASAMEGFAAQFGGIDHVLVALGLMHEQEDAEADPKLAAEMVAVNVTLTAQWAMGAADVLKRQGQGSLIVLGSPAGDRGRKRNFLYGMTKAAVATMMQGLAHQLSGRSVRAVLVKPGPTATKMTAHLPQRGLADAQVVARGVRRAMEHGPLVQYVPSKWGPIMFVVRLIPNAIFKRLNF